MPADATTNANGEAPSISGTALPGGTFTISAAEDRELRGAVGDADPIDGGEAHSLWAYVATQRGIGVSVAGLCELAEFDVADGPMLGSTELRFAAPLRVDHPYEVTGEIVDIVRKHGRSGTFDALTYRERLLDAGTEVARSESVWILPRREAQR